MKEPGKRMGEKAYGKMERFFKHYHIQTRFGKKIKSFKENEIVFADDSVLESDLIIFIAGGAGLDVITNAKLPVNEAGFIEIDESCKVKGYDNVFAIGDSASLKAFPWSAKQGHLAEVMADVSTYNLHNELRGKPKRKNYQDSLHIICIMDSGDGAAYVMRKHNKEKFIMMPVIGHWLKRAWGFYYKNTKLKRFPRMPGM